jgi:hypothetical protein
VDARHKDDQRDRVHLTRHSGTARERRTRNPDINTLLASGFRVRVFSAPGNDEN